MTDSQNPCCSPETGRAEIGANSGACGCSGVHTVSKGLDGRWDEHDSLDAQFDECRCRTCSMRRHA